MRQGQQNRRGRGRGGRKPQNPLARNYESNGPDVKIRGTAAHIAEKYMSLARDALASGDMVGAESYLQHAEHYNRIIMAAQTQAPTVIRAGTRKAPTTTEITTKAGATSALAGATCAKAAATCAKAAARARAARIASAMPATASTIPADATATATAAMAARADAIATGTARTSLKRISPTTPRPIR